MKLKKIASLMLAGIMAVSMLAGCKTADNGGNGGEGEGDVTPTSTTASVLRENLNGRAKRDVTAVSDGDLDATLQKAVDTYYTSAMYNIYRWNFDITNDVTGDVRETDLGKAVIGNNKSSITEINNDTDKKTVTAVEVYVVNSSVSDAYLLEQLGEKLSDCFDSDDDYPTMSYDQKYDYDYEIAASIVTVDGNDKNNESGLKFVALSMTKIVTEYV